MARYSHKTPRLPRLTAVADTKPVDNRARLKGARILVVDDDLAAREILSIVLGEAGALVLVADSKAQALQIAAENQFDALVSDLSMPGGDGITLLEELRAAGYEMPAIALSALPWGQVQAQVQRAGFALHLEKPTELSSLTAAVADVIGSARDEENL